MPTIEDEFDALNQKLDKPEYEGAADAAKEAADSIYDGVELIQNGDTMAGAAALLEGIGGLLATGAALAGGPVGAIVGGILSVITEIVALILKAFSPEKESLEERIKNIIKTEALMEESAHLTRYENDWRVKCSEVVLVAATRRAIQDAHDANTPFVFDPKTMAWPSDYPPSDPVETKAKNLLAGLSLDELDGETGYEALCGQIDDALLMLAKLQVRDVQWNALLDQATGYAFRLWISLHQLVGLIGEDAVTKYRTELQTRGNTWLETLEELAPDAQRNCQLYSRWHENGLPDNFDFTAEPFYVRVGILGPEASDWEQAGTKTTNFAVARSGTKFGCSSSGTVAVGRADWAEPEENGSPGTAHEVFIGEVPGRKGQVIVVCTEDDGKQLAVSTFNDTPGFPPDTGGDWTPHGARWGSWTRWRVPFRIGTVTIAPAGPDFRIYAVGCHDDCSAALYELPWGGTRDPVRVTAADVDSKARRGGNKEQFTWTREEIASAGGLNLFATNISPGDPPSWGPEGINRFAPLSMAISLTPFAVQLGSQIKLIDEGVIKHWDLASGSFFDCAGLETHQGRFYSDGTFLMCSTLGVHMRYWYPEEKQYVWKLDAAVQTECCQKIPLQNGPQFFALLGRLTELASTPVA